MHLPNYKDGSIVNLMSSIGISLGWNSKYKPLKSLPPKELSKNIVLLIIDGLGYEYLNKYGKKSFLKKHLRSKLTSVSPPTTAAAITTFLTGVAPQQHAITGWFMYLKELGVVSAVLPFHARYGGSSFEEIGVDRKEIFSEKEFSDRIKASYFYIMPKYIVGPESKKGRKVTLSYNTLRRFLIQTKKAINSHNKKKFIYAYWPGFDSICHEYGIKSREAYKHFRELDEKIKSFLKSIEGTNTTVIITADHGFVDTPKSKMIDLRKHPEFMETLTLPLSGDARIKYCFVRPSREKKFRNYVNRYFKNYCYLYKSEDLVKKNFFGLFNANDKLLDRVGDYILIMKDNYVMKDYVLGKKSPFHIGNHGGLSKEELYVPLIVVNK